MSYFLHYAVIIQVTEKYLWLCSLSCLISQMRCHTMLTMLHKYKSQKNNFHRISDWKMKSLTTFLILFYFTTIKWNLWLCSLCCFTLSLLWKWNLWLYSLHCFTSLLLLKWNLCLHSLTYFTSLQLKWNLWLRSLCCFTSLLLTQEITLLSLHCPYPSSIFLPRNFSVSIKFVCATVISPSGSSVESYMLYYLRFVMVRVSDNGPGWK